MGACTLECQEMLQSTFNFAKIEIAGAVCTPEEFLPIHAGVMLIASGARALAWVRKRKRNKERR